MKRAATFAMLLILLPAVACDDSAGSPSGRSECTQDRDCDDSVPCTVDRCLLTVNGLKRCENTPDDDACEPGFVCLTESILGPGCNDPARLACADSDEGDRCSVSDACATGNGECVGGRCEYPVRQCPERPCLVSLGCERDTGTCGYRIAPDEALCDADGDRCTEDTCHGGVCLEGPDTCECSESRPCVQPVNLCLGTAECVLGKCVSSPVDCSANDTACMQYYCVPATGLCASVVVNENGPCEDGLACTGTGHCAAGACLTTSIKCPDRPCNAVECVEPDGCVYTPREASCDDGDLCNGPDHCAEGRCLPSGDAMNCDDNNQCTLDQCVPETGACLNTPVLDCCGNGVLEQGEQCDGHGGPGSGCSECSFVTAAIESQGTSPSWAWSEELDSGVVAWEIVDSEGGRGIAVRPMSALGSLGDTIPIPAGTVRDRAMSPVVAASPAGFVLGALTQTAPEFWLLDGAARPRIKAAVRNPWNQGTPSGNLVAAWSLARSVAAWGVHTPGGAEQVLYADLAVGPDQILVSASTVLFTSEEAGTVIPGDACAVDGGVMVMFTVRSEAGQSSVIYQKAAFLQGGQSTVRIFDLAASEWDQPYTGRCARAADGRAFAVYPRMAGGAQPGILVEGVFVDPDDGPGIPINLASATMDSTNILVPLYSDLVAAGDGYVYLCPQVSPSIVFPEQVRPVMLPIGADGRPSGVQTVVDGPTRAFAGHVTGGIARDANLSVFWVETDSLSMLYREGRVAGKVYPAGQQGF